MWVGVAEGCWPVGLCDFVWSGCVGFCGAVGVCGLWAVRLWGGRCGAVKLGFYQFWTIAVALQWDRGGLFLAVSPSPLEPLSSTASTADARQQGLKKPMPGPSISPCIDVHAYVGQYMHI